MAGTTAPYPGSCPQCWMWVHGEVEGSGHHSATFPHSPQTKVLQQGQKDETRATDNPLMSSHLCPGAHVQWKSSFTFGIRGQSKLVPLLVGTLGHYTPGKDTERISCLLRAWEQLYSPSPGFTKAQENPQPCPIPEGGHGRFEGGQLSGLCLLLRGEACLGLAAGGLVGPEPRQWGQNWGPTSSTRRLDKSQGSTGMGSVPEHRWQRP